MDPHRENLLSQLRSIKAPIAKPTVQTFDMGIEYVVISSEGADRVLGRYGDWPLFGPLGLSSDDLDRLRQWSDQPDSNRFPVIGLEFIWKKIGNMLDYQSASDEEKTAFLREFVAAVLDKILFPDEQFYFYFHEYEREVPLLFRSRNELIDYFMSLHEHDWAFGCREVGECTVSWTAKITGDMTLSILDERGFKVLGVDMLRMDTMRAGDSGARLARTLNDMTLLAQAVDAANVDKLELWDASAGLSPRPWSVFVQDRKRQVQERDASGRRIAERVYPKSITPEIFGELAERINGAVQWINLRHPD